MLIPWRVMVLIMSAPVLFCFFLLLGGEGFLVWWHLFFFRNRFFSELGVCNKFSDFKKGL